MEVGTVKNTLEILFDRLHHNQHLFIPRILPDARGVYAEYIGTLAREEKRKVNYIKALLEYCEAERWMQARSLLEPAEEEYNKYFFRKIRSTTPSHQVPNYIKTHRPSEVLLGSLSGPNSRGVSRRSNRAPSKGGSQGSRKGSKMERPSSEPPKSRKAYGKQTDMSDLSSPQKIAEKFAALFKDEWHDAIEELEQLRIYEEKAAECLLRIVLDAYRVCAVEADTQIAKLEEAATSILMEGVSHPVAHIKGRRSLLLEYRRGVAEVCLERMKETFRRRYLPEIIRSVGVYQNIRTHGPVLLFANQCVAICWGMVILDPQVYLVDDRDSGQAMFNSEMYNAFTKEGPSLWYYVWPPLRNHKGGLLLSKGVAQGR
ncbi:uncharacterized protein LOC127879768 [Dreissena polymorpha]|nr:uncharacterized protein LOC127879768 [Dreissena polymorpha]